MVFSSLVFLSVFLPAVFLLYTVIPSLKVRNILLILASLAFYAYGEPVYVLLMLFSSVLNYLCARWVEHNPQKKSKAALVTAIVVNLGILAVFKYTGMFVTTFNSLTGLQVPVPEIALPIGISFFTFQALSYVIDVYRQDIGKIARGLRRFICGLAKKVFIANTMGQVADVLFAQDVSTLALPSAWLGAAAYLFQIYYDFSGYSDMAIGLGLMFGFEFKENFMYPYGAVSIQDFWRRWHISLSTWFKEYLYFPLGGNRKGKARTALNRLIVFFCTGLWHGANWTFVLWGLWHGLFLLLEEYVPVMRRLPKVLGHIYTMLVVILGFVLFRADTISYGFAYIGRMFAGFDFSPSALSVALTQLTPWFLVMLVVAIIGCAPIRPLADKIRANVYGGAELSKAWKGVQAALYVLAAAGLVWCMLRLSSGAYNPFIYFRF